MKTRKLWALLAVACMVLTLVPAFTLFAAADTALPARPADATNWVLDSNTTVTSNGTWDKGNNLMTAPGTGANMTVAPPAQVLEEDVVITFTLDRDMMYTWPLTRVYLANNLFVDICTGVNMAAYYNGESVWAKTEAEGLPGWWNAFQYGEGQAFSMYLHAEEDGTKTLDIFVGTTNVGTVTGLTLTNPTVSFQHGNECWGDTIYIRNADIYCPNGDPFIPILPERLEDGNNYDDYNIGAGTGSEADGVISIQHAAWNNGAQLNFPMAGVRTTDDYVMKFTLNGIVGDYYDWNPRIHLTDSIWNTNFRFDLSNGTMFYDNENATTMLTTNFTAPSCDVAIWAKYDKANDLRDYHLFINGAYVQSFEGLPAADPHLMLVSANTGSVLEVSNVDIYCPNGDPYIPPTVPAQPAGSTNWITSDKVTVDLLNEYSVFEPENNKLVLNLTAGNASADFAMPEQVLAEDYVIKFNLNTGNGWWDACYNVKLADDLIVKIGKANDRGALQINDKKFSIAMVPSYDWDQQWGDGTAVTIYVHSYKEGSAKKAVDVYLEGFYIGSVSGLDMTNPTLKFYNDSEQWGDQGTLTNLVMYTPNGDPEIPDPVPEIPTYDVTVEDVVGGTVTGAATDVEYGTTVELTATAAEGYTFKYWMINNRTYTDATITLTVIGDVTVVPVFVADEATDYTVTFRAKDGRVVATIALSDLIAGAELPAVPARYGFTNGVWETIVWEEITCDINVYTIYTKEETKYAINVTGGTASKAEASFDDAIVLTATDANFKAWKVNGVVVSTDAEYRCFVTGTMTIEAVTEEATDSAASVITDGIAVDVTKFNLVSIANVFVAADETFVEAGIVYSVTADAEDTLIIGAAGVGKKVSSITEAGQFMYVLNGAPVDTQIFVRSYVVTKDAGGNLVTTYSAVSSYTA